MAGLFRLLAPARRSAATRPAGLVAAIDCQQSGIRGQPTANFIGNLRQNMIIEQIGAEKGDPCRAKLDQQPAASWRPD